MKTLLIMRHGKSSWKEAGLADHDRPLKKRGRRDAPRMGRLAAAEGIRPDAILSSTATRAADTAQCFAEACGVDSDVRTTPSLYLASPEDYVALLRELPDTVETAMVIGHNPGIEELVHALTGQIEIMPTAALARVTLPVDGWKDLGEGVSGALEALWRPKELPGA